VLLSEGARGLVVEFGRLVGVAAGTEFGLDVLVGLRFLGLVFDFGLGLFGDLESAHVGLDTGRERVPDAVDFGEFRLAGRLDVVDALVAGLSERVRLRGTDAADVFECFDVVFVSHLRHLRSAASA